MQCREFLQAAAEVVGAAAGDVPAAEMTAQQNRLLKLADSAEEERWTYEMARSLSHIRSRLMNAEFDALCEGPSGTIETYRVDYGDVPLGFEVSTDDTEFVGTLIQLSADQAEVLAVDLLEQVRAVGEKSMSKPRVTARIVRTDHGENYTGYRVGSVSNPPDETVEAPHEARSSPQIHD